MNGTREKNGAAATANLVSLFDLDRTITVAPTFTPFLIHMAWNTSRWRTLALPVWIIAMLGYKLGLFRREALKGFGLRLFVGREVRNPRLQDAIDSFVARQIASNIRPAALRQIESDRAAGALLVMVTAAPEIYAEALAARLGFAACIATRHLRTPSGNLLATIDGHNNYGLQKVRRVEEWLRDGCLDRSRCHVTAYTDHASDAPILDFADKGVLVRRAQRVPARWQRVDWSARHPGPGWICFNASTPPLGWK